LRVEPAAAHGIKLEASKRERFERQTVIDPIPALFVCVLMADIEKRRFLMPSYRLQKGAAHLSGLLDK